MARYARLVAQGLGLSDDEQRNLYFAGLLHDIGLLKLDATEEWTRERIELHPLLGYEMIKDIIFWKDLAGIVLHHHERWDGRGYPEKLEGAAIPKGARIIGACEAFDVITAKNSYKSPLPYDMAIRELEAHAGTQFDPEIVDALKTSISEQDTIEKTVDPSCQAGQLERSHRHRQTCRGTTTTNPRGTAGHQPLRRSHHRCVRGSLAEHRACSLRAKGS